MQEASQKTIRVKRAYEAPAQHDGTRILVDRLWPRGLRKQDAAIDHWFKEIAPSTTLRQWFHHDPVHWEEFQRRYRAELSRNAGLLNELRTIARKGPLTLLYAARDAKHNHAIVLREVIEQTERISPSKRNVKNSGGPGAARGERPGGRTRST